MTGRDLFTPPEDDDNTQIASIGGRAESRSTAAGDLHQENILVRASSTHPPIPVKRQPKKRRVKKPGPVSPPTTWTLDIALRVLPAENRARYSEEYRAELADLPRRKRLRHAMRLASRSFSLRISLRADRPARVEDRSAEGRLRRALLPLLHSGFGAVAGGVLGMLALTTPGLFALMILLIVMLFVCVMWVLSNDRRTKRASRLIRAFRRDG